MESPPLKPHRVGLITLTFAELEEALQRQRQLEEGLRYSAGRAGPSQQCNMQRVMIDEVECL